MANDRRDGTPKVRSGGGGGGGRRRRWDDAVWPGEDGTVDTFAAALGVGDGADEGTVLVVEANRPSAWERMLEALESGELPVQAGPTEDEDVVLTASIAERVSAHAEWPARTRR